MEYKTLYNGVTIPMLGFGVFQIPDYDQAKAAVLAALGTGYRLIDTAQVALRWNLQRGVVVIPKTVHEERMRQNFDVFDFTLTQEDMEKIRGMDLGHSEIVNHFDPQWIKMLHHFAV